MGIVSKAVKAALRLFRAGDGDGGVMNVQVPAVPSHFSVSVFPMARSDAAIVVAEGNWIEANGDGAPKRNSAGAAVETTFFASLQEPW